MTRRKNKFIHGNLWEKKYEMEKERRYKTKLKLQAKVNKVFHSTTKRIKQGNIKKHTEENSLPSTDIIQCMDGYGETMALR